MIAAQNGHVEILNLLLNKNADANLKNNSNYCCAVELIHPG